MSVLASYPVVSPPTTSFGNLFELYTQAWVPMDAAHIPLFINLCIDTLQLLIGIARTMEVLETLVWIDAGIELWIITTQPHTTYFHA